jgi:hypothetical protein
MSNDCREAIKERNKLGYAVAKFVGAVDALLARAEECEYMDGLAEVAPSDFWAAVRSAGDEMTFRAEEFEAEYQRMKAAQSRHAAEREALVRRCALYENLIKRVLVAHDSPAEVWWQRWPRLVKKLRCSILDSGSQG